MSESNWKDPLTYEEWVRWSKDEISHNGKIYNNMGTDIDYKPYVENYPDQSTRVYIERGDELIVWIKLDRRYNYSQNRERLEMKQCYLDIGADKWELPEDMYTNPIYNLDE